MSDSGDPRADHIKNSTLKLLNITESDWTELMLKEKSQDIIKEFLDSSTPIFLLFYLDQNGKLTLCSEFPSAKYVSPKYAYFLKNNSPVSSKNFKREITFGNFCNTPLSQYKKIFEKVYLTVYKCAKSFFKIIRISMNF